MCLFHRVCLSNIYSKRQELACRSKVLVRVSLNKKPVEKPTNLCIFTSRRCPTLVRTSYIDFPPADPTKTKSLAQKRWLMISSRLSAVNMLRSWHGCRNSRWSFIKHKSSTPPTTLWLYVYFAHSLPVVCFLAAQTLSRHVSSLYPIY
jgi:hypothetical protein